MSFPAEGVESAIKNHIEDVRLFLDAKHPGRYAVYNLSPRTYRPSRFHSRVRGRASTPQDPLRDRSAPRRGRRLAPGLPRGSDGGRGRWAVSGSSRVGRAAPRCCSPGAPRSPRERKLRDADPVTAGPVRRAGRLQALVAGAAHVPWQGGGSRCTGWGRVGAEPPRAWPCPAGLRVRLGGAAGARPPPPVRPLQEHARLAAAGPEERVRGALRGECRALGAQAAGGEDRGAGLAWRRCCQGAAGPAS